MTEEKIEIAMERMGDAIEKTVDGAANKAWRHRPVRVIAKTISFLTGAGLIASTIPLTENGNTTAAKILILSRLVDTFISRISLTMLPVPNPHNTVCVLSWEEARHWQSRSSGYSSS